MGLTGEDRIEEAAREIRKASPIATVDNVWLHPILQRLYDDGKKAGAEEAAKERDHYKALWDADRARELREDIAARRTTL